MKEIKQIDAKEKAEISPSLLSIVAYRKSGLSLNHVIGCSLDCAYCVRHFFENFNMKEPHLICSNENAVNELISHQFFIPDITPIQLFNRATDPFLPRVKEYTHDLLSRLDSLKLTNQVLIITRANVSVEDVLRLEKLKNLKITLLLTYSGIVDTKIEPIAKSGTTVKSIKTISKARKRIKLVLYWRPIVSGWNDDDESFKRVLDLGNLVDAIVYTGYYHRPENHAYLREENIDINYDGYARRKFLSEELEERILNAYDKSNVTTPIFRKTSCGVAYAHQTIDFNGHWGVNEICDICPESQRNRCKESYKKPTVQEFKDLLRKFNYQAQFLIEDGHIWTSGLGEEKRYHLQHYLKYQVWDVDQPHFLRQHGRSNFGNEVDEKSKMAYNEMKEYFKENILNDDD